MSSLTRCDNCAREMSEHGPAYVEVTWEGAIRQYGHNYGDAHLCGECWYKAMGLLVESLGVYAEKGES